MRSLSYFTLCCIHFVSPSQVQFCDKNVALINFNLFALRKLLHDNLIQPENLILQYSTLTKSL